MSRHSLDGLLYEPDLNLHLLRNLIASLSAFTLSLQLKQIVYIFYQAYLNQ